MHRALVDRARQGDREAFDALARTVGDQCMAIAFRILRDADRADDAVQAALISAWRQLRSLRDPDAFEPWLHRILTHECYAEARRRTRLRAQIRVLHIAEQAESVGILRVNDRDQLDRAFRRLTLEQRAVLVFHHYVGLSLPDVALRLGIPLGTAKSRLHHATAALRASLEADARTAPTSSGAVGMRSTRDPDLLIKAFLDEGIDELPDRSFDAVRTAIDQKRQWAVFGPWKESQIMNATRIAVAAVAIVVVAVLAIKFLPTTSVGPDPDAYPDGYCVAITDTAAYANFVADTQSRRQPRRPRPPR